MLSSTPLYFKTLRSVNLKINERAISFFFVPVQNITNTPNTLHRTKRKFNMIESLTLKKSNALHLMDTKLS